MSRILQQYKEDGYQITEYTRDGVNVSARIKQPIPIEYESAEPEIEVEPNETLEEKLARLEATIEQNNLINLDIQLSLYEQILALQNQLGGNG